MIYNKDITNTEIIKLEYYISQYQNYKIEVYKIDKNKNPCVQLLSGIFHKLDIMKELLNITNINNKLISITGVNKVKEDWKYSEWSSQIISTDGSDIIKTLKSFLKIN